MLAPSLQELDHAEPSSDFPTIDDETPCARPTRAMLALLVLAAALLAGAVGYGVARARARDRFGA